mgnify:CR=1 FL=1
MAGGGLRLNKFFNKKSMSSHIAGAGYSIVITIAPMLLVIVTLIIMQRLLGYTQESYPEHRALYFYFFTAGKLAVKCRSFKIHFRCYF